MSADDRVTTNLRKGVLEFCVLAHIQAGDAYGFELARVLEADGLIAGEGTLYPLLTRLRSSGLVETRWVESDAGRPRKYYTLTPVGVAQLEAFQRAWIPLRDAVDQTMRRSS
ncbi:PadR family transcriptional regulator [Microbacterium sp. BWT-B31]|uniref:PadR family transcriptional regulator n=1 Tax=Microbacterium sp. BWT-B31 TaxID=3232072 RepID=UPI003528EB5B